MEAFIGTVMMFAGNFAPRGWMMCQGQLLPISQNSALFAILGTTYGGNGQTTFGLPDLRSRVPVGMGQGPGLSNVTQGQMWGAENVTLLTTQIPTHAHESGKITVTVTDGVVDVPVSTTGGTGISNVPTGLLSPDGAAEAFTNANAVGNGKYSGKSLNVKFTQVAATAERTSIVGGSQPHPNIQPSLGMNYIICTEGIFPSRS